MGKRNFNVGQFFEDCGYKVNYYPNKMWCTQFSAVGNIFLIRSIGSTLQVAILSTFDRWANSIDFITGIPASEKQAIRKYSAIVDLYEANILYERKPLHAVGNNLSRIANVSTKKTFRVRTKK